MTLRNIDSTLKTYLAGGQPVSYCHLVKFQRPYYVNGVTDTVVASTDANKYAYITDCSFDVNFDDGSFNSLGVANGVQTYVTNKILSIGSIQEEVEARVSSIGLTLDALSLGATVTGSITITSLGSGLYSITAPTGTYLTDLGFKDGDKITLSGGFTGSYNVNSFSGDNVFIATPIGFTPTTGTATATINLSSDELMALLADKTSPTYASFKNKSVDIWRVYFDPETFDPIGQPIKLFKGVILSGGSITRDSAGLVKVSWKVSSLWGNFQRVNGRLTSDQDHRALTSSGVPQPDASRKPEYAYDKGFIHAETSVTVLSSYKVDVEKTSVKYKSGFLGFGAKIKVSTYTVQEDRQVNLSFNLTSQYIPVIYGVRATTGITVFADSLAANPSTLYTCNILSEGPIGGIFDVYVGGSSLICSGFSDFTARNTAITTLATGTVLCRGRADRGDVLGSQQVTTTSVITNFYSGYQQYLQVDGRNPLADSHYPQYVNVVTEPAADVTGSGVFDGQGVLITTPIPINIDLYAGRRGQLAASNLITIASSNGFKIQSDYWTTKSTEEYWGPNHKLIDSAYTVTKAIISSTDTTIPDITYVVKGKLVECYNYDFSYEHDITITGESFSNFDLGDLVDIYDSSNNLLNSQLQIVDKWTFVGDKGIVSSRFRFNIRPSLGYNSQDVPSITSFYMKKGTSKWSMITYNNAYVTSTIATRIVTPTISSISNNSGFLRINFSSSISNEAGVSDVLGTSAMFRVASSAGVLFTGFTQIANLLLSGTISGTHLDTFLLYSDYQQYASTFTGKILVSANTVILPSVISTALVNPKIKLSRRDSSTGDISYFYSSIGTYNNTYRVAFLNNIPPLAYCADVGDSVVVYSNGDTRVSINPAMQLLDYIRSTIYGAGAPSDALAMPTWLATARVNDGRSNVTVKTTTSLASIVVGDTYSYSSGNMKFIGTVLSTTSDASFGNFITFTNVIGKLTNRWNNWRSFLTGDLVYNSTGQIYSVTSSGIKSTEPTHTTGVVNGLTAITSLTLASASGTGASSVTLDITLGNPIKFFNGGLQASGYSLYDSDDVTYWRYLGWDSFEQRNVTRYQTNIMLDTGTPVFDNINAFLGHFDAVLRQENGQYVLETQVFDPAPTGIQVISDDNIIGDITITDDGTKTSFNSVSVTYLDPSNQFQSKNISFYNSVYKKQDNGLDQKGNVNTPGITNYLNARMAAEKFLIKSRFGLSVSFIIQPFAIAYTPNTIISLTYSKFGWASKLFIISSLTILDNAMISITANEVDVSMFYQSSVNKVSDSVANYINKPNLGGLATASNIDLAGPIIINKLAENIDYGSGASVESLAPQEIGANVTENRVSLAVVGQTAWATYTSSISSIALPGANIVFDGGFKLKGKGWTAPSYGFNTGPDIGYYASSTVASATLISPSVSIVGNVNYTVQTYAGYNTWTTPPTVNFNWYNSSNALISQSAAVQIPSTGYHKVTLTSLAPSTATSMKIVFTGGSGGSGGSIFTKVKLELGSVASVFTDEATNSALYSSGINIDTLQPQEIGANVTENRVSLAVVGQTAWATYSGTVASVTTPNANLVFDGGFRLQASGWILNNWVASTGADVGPYMGTSVADRYLYSPLFPVAASTAYTLQGYGAYSGRTTASGLLISWYTSAGVFISSTAAISFTTAYGRISATYTSPSNAAYARAVSWSGLGTGNSIITKMKVEKGSVVSVFSDETTNGALYSSGIDINSLQPQEIGSNVTETRIASGITGQTAWATYTATIGSIATPGANLVFDGGFKLDGQGWNLGPGWTSGQGFEVGPYMGTTTPNIFLLSPDFVVASSTSYTIQCTGYYLTRSTAAYIRIDWMTSAHAYISSSPLANLPINTLGIVSVTGTSPSNAAYARVSINSGLGAGSAVVSKVKVEKGSITSIWSDETTNGALYQSGATIDSLQPQEISANVTENRVALAFAGQTAWATYSGSIASVTAPNANIVFDGQFVLKGQNWTLGGWTAGQGSDIGPYMGTTLPNINLISPFFNVASSSNYSLQAFCAYSSRSTAPTIRIDWHDSGHNFISSTSATAFGTSYGIKISAGVSPSIAAYGRVVIFSGLGFGTSIVTKVKVENSSISSVFSDDSTSGALYANGIDINTLIPAEAGSNVTETRISSGITGQGSGATTNVGTVATQDANNVSLTGGVLHIGSSALTIVDDAQPTIPLRATATSFNSWSVTDFNNLSNKLYPLSNSSQLYLVPCYNPDSYIGTFCNNAAVGNGGIDGKIRTGVVKFKVKAGAQVYGSVSIWYKRNSNTSSGWTFLASSNNTWTDDMHLTAAWVGDISISSGDFLLFAVGICDSTGSLRNGSFRNFSSAYCTIDAINM